MAKITKWDSIKQKEYTVEVTPNQKAKIDIVDRLRGLHEFHFEQNGFDEMSKKEQEEYSRHLLKHMRAIAKKLNQEFY